VAQGYADAADLERIRDAVQAEIESGVQFALDAPFPDASEVDTHVYA
jgi:TPP-dependent pyruvate/acetoin dehydrogenase alpha subunit